MDAGSHGDRIGKRRGLNQGEVVTGEGVGGLNARIVLPGSPPHSFDILRTGSNLLPQGEKGPDGRPRQGVR